MFHRGPPPSAKGAMGDVVTAAPPHPVGIQLLRAPSTEEAPLRLASTAAAAPGSGTLPSFRALSGQ